MTGKGIKKSKPRDNKIKTTQKPVASQVLARFQFCLSSQKRDDGRKSQTQKLLTKLWKSFQRGKKKN